MMLPDAMDQLQRDLDADDPEVFGPWLDLVSVPGGICDWGRIVRQDQRLRARDLLCKFSQCVETWFDAGTALTILEAAARCSSLTPPDFRRAAQLAQEAHRDTPFARYAEQKAIS